jgi:hypothetical protein
MRPDDRRDGGCKPHGYRERANEPTDNETGHN